MKAFKGTKGEFKDGSKGWKAVAYGDNNKVGYSTHEIHFSDDGECIAEVVHGEANAKLIAAAPQLLEAAIKAYVSIRHEKNPSNSQLDAYYELEKAISKALE